MGEVRHRLKKEELEPVKNAIYDRLFILLDTRPEDELENAENLFRAWYRIVNHITHRPIYPDHETYDQIARGVGYNLILWSSFNERYPFSKEVGAQ